MSLHDTVGREEVTGHGAIQVREVWEDVFHSRELLRGAHEGGQVIGDGFRAVSLLRSLSSHCLLTPAKRVKSTWAACSR